MSRRKDIGLKFQIHKATNDIIPVLDEFEIRQSIINLLLTNQGERVLNFDLGGNIRSMLFDLNNIENHSFIALKIKNVIINADSRIQNVDVSIGSSNANSLSIDIRYNTYTQPLYKDIQLQLEQLR